MSDPGKPIPPGATIGILGGGQLGRMTALAAGRLGYRCHIFCPEADSPAAQVSDGWTQAAYDDETALAQFAEAVDVVTYEFENIPVETVELLDAKVPVRPGAQALRVSQDRLQEKDFLNKIGVPTAPYAEVTEVAGLRAAVQQIGTPAVLKTARFGYDGKGQTTIRRDADLEAAWTALGTENAILEGLIDFHIEMSVIVARGGNGRALAWTPGENYHRNHILDTTIVPARVPEDVMQQAEAYGRHIAEKLELVGLVAVELFVTQEGRLLANEIAPRPHNSGHWTMDGALTSQFEQLVRAICGLPLGAVDRTAEVAMKNLIGEDFHTWPQLMAEPGALVHLYGKGEVREGRKMGHVNRLTPRWN